MLPPLRLHTQTNTDRRRLSFPLSLHTTLHTFTIPTSTLSIIRLSERVVLLQAMHTQTVFLRQHLSKPDVPDITRKLDRLLSSQLTAMNALRLVDPFNRYFADIAPTEKGGINQPSRFTGFPRTQSPSKVSCTVCSPLMTLLQVVRMTIWIPPIWRPKRTAVQSVCPDVFPYRDDESLCTRRGWS